MASRRLNGVDWLGQPAAVFPGDLQEMHARSNAEVGTGFTESTSSRPSLHTHPTTGIDMNLNTDSQFNLDNNHNANLQNNFISSANSSTDSQFKSKSSTGSHLFPVRPRPPNREEVQAGIRECLKVQGRAVQNGKLPFGACLMESDNTTVVLTQGNVDHVNHAESTLARSAAAQFTQEYLWTCTLYTTWEPCAMCASTIYWANIGRIVYAASNDQLQQLTGKNNPLNMTMKWHCRDILRDSQKDIDIIGPIPRIDKVVMMESDVYWSQIRSQMSEDDYDHSRITCDAAMTTWDIGTRWGVEHREVNNT